MRSKIVLAAVAVASLFAFTLFHPIEARAGVHVNVGINLPALVFPAPPPVVVVPETYVYYAPDVNVDVLFYHGYWYRPYEGRWFRSGNYNGPWVHIVRDRVPGAVLHLPPDYRRARSAYKPVPYGQLRRNWRTWERERHWERAERRHERERREPRGREDRGWEERAHERGAHRGR